ncbi:MAG: hypothetical protein ACRDQA_25955 [Nocardioidaceae bacterium]
MFRGRVQAEGDPYWTDLDRGYALAWREEDMSTCDGCGQPYEESMDRKHQFGYTAEIVRCHACAAKDRAGKHYADADGADTNGLMVQLTKTPHDAT